MNTSCPAGTPGGSTLLRVAKGAGLGTSLKCCWITLWSLAPTGTFADPAQGIARIVRMEGNKMCELCKGTGWYGDNGPGIKGNREYIPCECRAKKPAQCPRCGRYLDDGKCWDCIGDGGYHGGE